MRSLARRHERLTAERRSRKLKDLALSLCFIGPSVLGVLIFFVLPFCVVVYYSVIRNSINPEFVFLDNFIALFQNSAFRDAAKTTATFLSLIHIWIGCTTTRIWTSCRVPSCSASRPPRATRPQSA